MQLLSRIGRAIISGLERNGRNRAIAHLESFGYRKQAQILKRMKDV